MRSLARSTTFAIAALAQGATSIRAKSKLLQFAATAAFRRTEPFTTDTVEARGKVGMPAPIRRGTGNPQAQRSPGCRRVLGLPMEHLPAMHACGSTRHEAMSDIRTNGLSAF